MISIRVQQLTKRFGTVTALHHLDLTIEPGELFFLLGPSGCGKTTLLRSLAGFYIPDEGTIRFGDEDVTRLAPHKRNTGMMFQSYALWPHMSVAENVAFGRVACCSTSHSRISMRSSVSKCARRFAGCARSSS